MLLVGERMGLNLSLATAPRMFFVRNVDPTGREMNLEATTAGIRRGRFGIASKCQCPIAPSRASFYLRTLTRREVVALMATIVVEFLISDAAFRKRSRSARPILQHAPRNALTMVTLAHAYGQLMNAEFVERYPIPAQIPPALRIRYAMLARRNQQMFQAAEALGWEPPLRPQTTNNQARSP